MIHLRSLRLFALAVCALAALIATGSVVEAKGTHKNIERKANPKGMVGAMRKPTSSTKTNGGGAKRKPTSSTKNKRRNRSRHNFRPMHPKKDSEIKTEKRTTVSGALGAKDGFFEGSPIQSGLKTRNLSGKGKGKPNRNKDSKNNNGNKNNNNNNRNTNDGFDAVETAEAEEVTTNSAALAVYDNKCDAAEAGAEFKTSSFVEVYYQYEIVTSTSRNILQLADIVDKAIQHFLAVWMVDCDTEAASTVADTASVVSEQDETQTGFDSNIVDDNGMRRLHSQKEQRQLQMSLVPIAGTGTGDFDIVLMGGTEDQTCSSLVASAMLGQVCYKVVGSVLVYIDETMQVTPKDVQTLALETLTVGMNYAATDFSELDPDIYGLMLVQGYDEPPEELMAENWEANKRVWDTSTQNANPFGNNGRSGGAKFGIAFATLLCIAVVVFLCAYMFKNRKRLFRDFDLEEFFCCCCTCSFGSSIKDSRRRQDKHHCLDDSMTVPSTIKSHEDSTVPPTRRFVQTNLEPNFRTFSSSPESTGTRPLSPDPETPHHPSTARERIRVVQQHREQRQQHQQPEELEPQDLDEDPTFMEQRSNIETPRSEWSAGRSSNIVDQREEESYVMEPETPDDRIRIHLSKDAIRGSYRKASPKAMASPRSYNCEDTVDL